MFICRADYPVVQTKYGKIRGFYLDGCFIFRGIKYADAKRFQMPVETASWDGTKDALSYGYTAKLMKKPKAKGEIMVAHQYWPSDENCQYLNIWTPSIKKGAGKPVMVWLHGGSFDEGSSIEQIAYDGKNLSMFGDVVIVSLNHRLNILGYWDLSDLGKKYWNTGNLGNADIIAALCWIQDNIAGFGGDPGNVTLFGQSGGGTKILTLMQSPAANRLFHKGIIQSGVLENLLSQDEKTNHAFIKELEKRGLAKGELLEKMPYHELAKVYKDIEAALIQQGYTPVWCPVENEYYYGNPLKKGFCERARQIPIIIGSVFGEFDFSHGIDGKEHYPENAVKRMLQEQYGAGAEKLQMLFQEAYPDKHPLDLLSLDNYIRSPEIQLIKIRTMSKESRTFSYMFCYNFALDGGKPAWHCSEIPFVFHNIEKVPVCNDSLEAKYLERQMAAAWSSFARTGIPSIEGEKWRECSLGEEKTMIFDRDCSMKINYDHALLSVHKKYFDGASRIKKD